MAVVVVVVVWWTGRSRAHGQAGRAVGGRGGRGGVAPGARGEAGGGAGGGLDAPRRGVRGARMNARCRPTGGAGGRRSAAACRRGADRRLRRESSVSLECLLWRPPAGAAAAAAPHPAIKHAHRPPAGVRRLTAHCTRPTAAHRTREQAAAPRAKALPHPGIHVPVHVHAQT